MKFFTLFIVIISLFSCSVETREKNLKNTYIQDDIERIEDRIEFILTTLNKLKDRKLASRRDLYMVDEANWFVEKFEEIKDKLKNNNSIDQNIEEIEKVISNTIYFMDANINEIDDVIQEKLRLHIVELKMLGFTASILDDLELTHSLLVVKGGFLNTIFTISRTDKYTFEKVEVLPFDRNYYSGFKADEGDSVEVSLLSIAYDSTYLPKIVYWIDDSTWSKSNAIEYNGWEPIKFGGEKGEHTVYGEYNLYPNNREDIQYFQFNYEIK